MTYSVEMKNITKSFPGVIANKDISINVNWGEIFGLIGENGAGKTTLMNILYGIYKPDHGQILIDGKEFQFQSPKDAIDNSIGMVHQHFTLVPSLSVAQNIILGKPIKKRNGLVDIKKASKVVIELGEKYHLQVNPNAIVSDLPVAIKQRIEILKALYLGAKILILDEPTAVLTPQEIDQLIKTLKSLKQKGNSIILITHKLKELMDSTDNITVLRNGTVTGKLKTVKTNEKEIATLMVGKNINFEVKKEPAKPKNPMLKVKSLYYTNKFNIEVLKNINFDVRSGEIVGIAGVQGNGQTELIEAISGINREYSGRIYISGKLIENNFSTKIRRKLGLGHIPEDRRETGTSLAASLLENFIMGGLDNPVYAGKFLINYDKAGEIAEKQFQHFNVKSSGIHSEGHSLSGGNLQKVILARELYLNPVVLIAAQPTRGLDIGAAKFIHENLVKMRDNGGAILLISYELSEIMELSDRILVLYNGEIVGETYPEESSEQDIGLLMAGIKKENKN